MSGQQAGVSSGRPLVMTSRDGGLSDDQLIELAMNRFIVVAKGASEQAHEQARAFKDRVRTVLAFYFKRARQSERDKLIAQLSRQGNQDLANIIRRL